MTLNMLGSSCLFTSTKPFQSSPPQTPALSKVIPGHLRASTIIRSHDSVPKEDTVQRQLGEKRRETEANQQGCHVCHKGAEKHGSMLWKLAAFSVFCLSWS